ncbi:hypothetical protein B9T62_06995 [Paenibacillus donghaensis]|uniref:Uncharacterized protein n=1 Tax=Paenibacillus donghaensis TaxID=414771 RepID=A0A2Z2K4A1_9BACL|nr:hypothetical protein B9T62_06995 [Paenibacillus donghaensis]
MERFHEGTGAVRAFQSPMKKRVIDGGSIKSSRNDRLGDLFMHVSGPGSAIGAVPSYVWEVQGSMQPRIGVAVRYFYLMQNVKTLFF